MAAVGESGVDRPAKVKETRQPSAPLFDPVLPTTGLVYPQASDTTPILCKPRIMPLKSASLLKQEQLAKQAEELGKQKPAGNQ
eukprot:m.472398 g.472398  ORF g.472398 m.472398 type:complete len:83 (-) comp20384_c0_seq1:136-384(-)